MSRYVWAVRDEGCNLLAWSPDQDAAEQAAEEIDDAGRGRAVRVKEEPYSEARHDECVRCVPAAK